MGKAQIIRRIHNAAKKYKDYFIGNTYMFVYEQQFVEVIFKKTSFLHLTGVNTNLNAERFFTHALAKKGLRPQEVSFDSDHPYDLADKKTSYLADLYEVTHVFKKKTGQKKYNELTFGDKTSVNNLHEEIQNKVEMSAIVDSNSGIDSNSEE